MHLMHAVTELRAMGGGEVDRPSAITRILPILIARLIARPTSAAERHGAGDFGIDFVVPVTLPVTYLSFNSV